MPAVKTSEPCTICECRESIMHSHHTVPQARGGKDSLQIILCGSCHNVLHANAVHLVSKVRNPNLGTKSFWKTERDASRAERWLQILVTALLTPCDVETEHIVTTKLLKEDFQLFKILAKDLGCSQEKAVEYCIQYVLDKRGIKREKNNANLWFMPVSKQR